MSDKSATGDYVVVIDDILSQGASVKKDEDVDKCKSEQSIKTSIGNCKTLKANNMEDRLKQHVRGKRVFFVAKTQMHALPCCY